MEIEIVNLTNEKLPIGKIERIAKRVAQKIGFPRDALFSIVFIDSKGMLALNKQYKHGNEPTDVLAFSLANKDEFILPEFVRGISGEIFLCSGVIKKKAKGSGQSPDAYRKLLIVHAFLHLKGLQHESEADALAMEAKEKQILTKLE